MKSRVLVVTGGRTCLADDVWEALDERSPDLVLVGCCPTGADRAARRWCRERGVPCGVFRARWKRLGKAAGPKRNAMLVAAGVAVGAEVLAFPRGGPGTADCMRKARRAGLRVEEL